MVRALGNVERQRGSALIGALVISLAVLLLGSAFLAVSLNDRTVASNETNSVRAFDIAESGLEHATAEMPDRTVNTVLTAGSLFTNRALGGGTYSVLVTNNTSAEGTVAADAGGATNDTDGFIVLRSTGVFDDATRTVRVMVHQTINPPPIFRWAAFGDTELKLSNSEIYGDAGSNANMTFSGAAPKVYGAATAGGTISSPSSYVTGTATQSGPHVTLASVPCPATAWGPAPTGAGYTFDSSTGQLSINGPVTFPAGTYYYTDVSKSGGDDISIPTGAFVDIYIDGKLQMSGGGFNNPNNAALNFQIWGCGSDTSDWAVTGPQESWFTIYAPSHGLKFTGGGSKRGSFIGKKFENSGPGDTIYDSALASTGSNDYTRVRGSWTELW